MCRVCHWLYGLGYGPDDLIVYEGFAGNFYETKGARIRMDSEDLREAVARTINERPAEEEWKIMFMGEIAVQLACMSEHLEGIQSYLAAILERTEQQISSPSVSSKPTDEELHVAMEAEDVDQANS